METEIRSIDAEIELAEAIKELREKAVQFLICFAAFVVFFKLTTSDATLWELFEGAFSFSLMFYLPYKISYKVCGSILGAFLLSFVVVIVIGLLIGDSSILLSLVLLGGLAIDFGISILKIRKAKQLLDTNEPTEKEN